MYRYLAAIHSGIWNGRVARDIMESQGFLFASRRVGGLKYFFTKFLCIANITLSTLLLIELSDIPLAHEFCESSELPRNFQRVTFNISCFEMDFPFLLCP